MSVNDYFTKEFSVKSLTKGTTILDAICCLIDNSVDAAEKSKEEKINIEIFLDKKQIVVMDNALGISSDEAKNMMLKVGEKNSFKDIYGNGMKKAILVIGKYAEIRSVNNKSAINIKLNVSDKKNDDELWKPYFEEEIVDESNGFIIRICSFTDKMKEAMRKGKNYDFFTKLKERIGYKYRYIIESNRISIILNGVVVKAKHVDAIKVAEKKRIIKGVEVNVKLFKNIKDKLLNGIDFVVNKRCVVEKEKSNNIYWNFKIRKKGHSYSRFYGEVIIDTDNIEILGVNPSKNKINFSAHIFKEILDFMMKVIEENRKEYRKNTIAVQLEIEEEQLNELQELLGKQGIQYKYAKDLVEHVYELGVNRVKEDE